MIKRAEQGRAEVQRVQSVERRGAAEDFASHAARVGGDEASRRDLGASAGMLKQGYTHAEVVQALHDHSSDLGTRHQNAEHYAMDTVMAAQSQIDTEASRPITKYAP